jgi:hypothetical protein
MFVGAGADEVAVEAIRRRALIHQAADLHFRKTLRNTGQTAAIQVGGNFIEQRIGVGRTNAGQHALNIAFGMGDEGHGNSAWMCPKKGINSECSD